jgi:hypothetical protein
MNLNISPRASPPPFFLSISRYTILAPSSKNLFHQRTENYQSRTQQASKEKLHESLVLSCFFVFLFRVTPPLISSDLQLL